MIGPSLRIAVLGSLCGALGACTVVVRPPAPDGGHPPVPPAYDAGPLLPDDAGAPAADGGAADAGPAAAADDGGLILYSAPGPFDPSTVQDEVITVQRGFTCTPEDVGPARKLADVDGATDEQVILGASGQTCAFNLTYQDATGQVTALSTKPSGWLLTAAKRFSDGVRVVCTSELRVTPTAGAANQYEIGSVPVRCWAGSSAPLTATVEAVPPSSDYAAWVRELKPHPSQPGQYLLVWARDFSFQFFNMGDVGRPATDGVYETVLVFDGSTLQAQPAVMTSTVTNPLEATHSAPWAPTAAELNALGIDLGTP